jgi:hypothetical protein
MYIVLSLLEKKHRWKQEPAKLQEENSTPQPQELQFLTNNQDKTSVNKLIPPTSSN